MGLTMGYDINQMIQEWRINGFVVFEDLIPHEKVDRIREAWIPVRDRDIERQGEQPVRGFRRYNVRVPFTQPFVDQEIFEHPALVAFLTQAMGPDYVWSHFDSNIPLPGTDYQSWHRDGQVALFPGVKTPAISVGVKFPLVDTCEENGSFEVLPGTQYITDEDLLSDLDDVFWGRRQPHWQLLSHSAELEEGFAVGARRARLSPRHAKPVGAGARRAVYGDEYALAVQRLAA